MRNPFKYFFIILLLSAGLFLFSGGREFMNSLLGNLYAIFSKVFEEKVSPEDLLQKYQEGKIKILIVPGHDDVSVGGQFGNIKETDLNIELAYSLWEFFKDDKNFEIYFSRDNNGNYTKWFSDYLFQNREEIKTFRDYFQSVGSVAKKEGWMTKEVKIIHNSATDDSSFNLYALNKIANDNDMDVVLHIHFNDYSRASHNIPGEYIGFAIYVPEKQLPNSRTSIALANSIKEHLEKYVPPSSFPGESDTIVEEQELIAIGSNASRKGASLLIEYGYIYESQFINSGPRAVIMKELAAQTYWGIKNYFDPKLVRSDLTSLTTLLPYEWNLTLKKGMRGLKDTVHLQAALMQEGLYPPNGQSLLKCPINGNFGPCTEKAVKLFQRKYGISPVGIVGPQTLDKLNKLYSS